MCSTGCPSTFPSPIAAAGVAHLALPQLDVCQLEDNVSFYLGQALAPSTRQSYKSGQRRFVQFCQEATLQPFPLSEQLLSMFVAYLGKENLSYQTIKSYLSAIRFLSISTGQGDPFRPGAMPVLQYVLRGIKRMPKSSPQTRLPVTPVVLRTLKMQWERHASNCDFVMLWAAYCVGFFGFLRAGEFTVRSASDFDQSSSLTLQDVAVDQHTDPSVVQIRLKQSKTDPFRHGIDIFLGRTNTDLCPVSALLAYVAVRPPVVGPLFVYHDGSFLTREKLVAAVRLALQQAGMDASKYSGHSFRIGAATTAAKVGLEDSVIKMLGRWESTAYQRYIHTPRDTLAAISVRLAGGSQQ